MRRRRSVFQCRLIHHKITFLSVAHTFSLPHQELIVLKLIKHFPSISLTHSSRLMGRSFLFYVELRKKYCSFIINKKIIALNCFNTSRRDRMWVRADRRGIKKVLREKCMAFECEMINRFIINFCNHLSISHLILYASC